MNRSQLMRRLLPLLVLAAVPGLTALAAIGLPYTLVYPTVQALGPGGLRLEVHAPGTASMADCADIAERMAAPIRAAPGASQLTVRTACRSGLAGDDVRVLGAQPLSMPSARTRDGTVLTYQADDANLAQAVCQQAASASAAGGPAARFSCYAAGQGRR